MAEDEYGGCYTNTKWDGVTRDILVTWGYDKSNDQFIYVRRFIGNWPISRDASNILFMDELTGLSRTVDENTGNIIVNWSEGQIRNAGTLTKIKKYKVLDNNGRMLFLRFPLTEPHYDGKATCIVSTTEQGMLDRLDRETKADIAKKLLSCICTGVSACTRCAQSAIGR